MATPDMSSFYSAFSSLLTRTILSDKPQGTFPMAGLAPEKKQKPAPSVVATASFDEAVKLCREKVEKIAATCRRDNLKYRDIHFDLGLDEWFCTSGLVKDTDLDPASVARVHDIFDEPSFFKDGATAGDIKQGQEGDCWFLAAIATVTNVKGLIEKICVARDEAVGVYGFVFLRDSVWVSVIVDDQLMLKNHALHDTDGLFNYYFEGKEAAYEKVFVRGSSALICASCEDENETWLPLLEKAYAKVHGDYSSISGGWTGEAVEDLTGGVTAQILSADILDRDAFWKDLLRANQDYLFGAATLQIGESSHRQGVHKDHAYSVLKAVEVKGKRFVLCRNPWGKSEYTGPWSDGSKEWTPEWLSLLDHKFGDDGQFWMEYKDFLKVFQVIDRTRLFDETWRVTEMRWVPYDVPWRGDYSKTRFRITVTQETETVIVLSQLDDRYFQGLEGEYSFTLHFRVHRKGEEDYIIRSLRNVYMCRSVSATIKLTPGVYDVIFSVESELLTSGKPVSEIVQTHKNKDRKKFSQIAKNADLAFERAGCRSAWREADINNAHQARAFAALEELAIKREMAIKAEEEAKKQKEEDEKRKKEEEEEEEKKKKEEEEKAEAAKDKETKVDDEKKDDINGEKKESTEEEKKVPEEQNNQKPKAEGTEDKKDEQQNGVKEETQQDKTDTKDGNTPNGTDTKTAENKADEKKDDEKKADIQTNGETASKSGDSTTTTNGSTAPNEKSSASETQPTIALSTPSSPRLSPTNHRTRDRSPNPAPKPPSSDDAPAPAPTTTTTTTPAAPAATTSDPNSTTITINIPTPSRALLEESWFKFLEPKFYDMMLRMAENHSWKARVCVGLKVYSKDPELTVDVVEPGKPETEEENESTKVMVDLDDSTRDVKPVYGGADAGAGLTDPSAAGAAENGEEKKDAVNGETKEKVGEKKGDEEVLKEAVLEDID